MSLRCGAPALLATLAACQPSAGVLIEVDAPGGASAGASSLTFTVVQGKVLTTQTFRFDAGLPQTVGLNSGGLTMGPLLVVAQAVRGTSDVAAFGRARASPSVERPAPTVRLELVPACPDGGACTCRRANCFDVGAECGSVLDRCGGVIDCGNCSAAATCAEASGVPSCRTGACSAEPCGAACGLKQDGCGSVLDCGPCDAGA